MIQKKNHLVVALLVPIVALLTLTAYKKYVLSYGKEVVLSISGYDPRDLLSGHYLIYRVDYGIENICSPEANSQEAFVCLDPKMFSYSYPSDCSIRIRGICNYGRFEAGIERYYIPEDRAKSLEEEVRTKKASIVISVPENGHAQVKDLLIDGKTWKKL